MTPIAEQPIQPLKETCAAYRVGNLKLRIHNSAEVLSVSEAELLASESGNTTTRLHPNFTELLADLPSLGRVIALTHSSGAVHEVTANFGKMSVHGNTAMYFRPGQDTRYFLERWQYAFAVNENNRLSLQFFGRSGEIIHKIYLVDDSDFEAYHQLIYRYRMAEQTKTLEDIVYEPTHNMVIIPGIDISDLNQRWSKIQDVHEGNRIIKDFGHHSRLVYRALRSDYASLLNTESVEKLLNLLVESHQECMIFAKNGGAVQSYAGLVVKLLRTGSWLNVLDPEFNLHLRTDLIGESWKITKPSVDGWIHSVVVFDKDGQEMLVFTDNRSKGQEESTGWRNILLQL